MICILLDKEQSIEGVITCIWGAGQYKIWVALNHTNGQQGPIKLIKPMFYMNCKKLKFIGKYLGIY